MARFTPLIVLSCALLAPACKSTKPTAAPDDGVSAIQFQDIVVPSGMKLQESNHESHSMEASGYRMGHFLYEGMPKVEEASSHILQRMPQHNWTLVSDEKLDEMTRKLKFSRGRYVAEYTLHRQDGVTNLVIDYKTEAR
jgi:hypothetical protein